MKIVIFTIGTRGDVQPYIALGRGLQQAGHRALQAALAMHAGLAYLNRVCVIWVCFK